MRSTIIFYFCFFGIQSLFAQIQDPVLFTVNDNPVHVSEFEYIYNKNNGEDADYSRESIEEYLDLYIKFKLKVERAKEMGLDTVKALQDELAGYRKQLSNSYLLDKEVTRKLLHEAFERMQHDIRVSHILVKVKSNAPKAQQEAAYQKALELKEELEENSFRFVAQTKSDDKFSARKGGDIGFLTALMPKGFYAFENAMYNLSIGEVSDPVKSKVGFHIIKVTDLRPARGQINISHILIRKKDRGVEIPDAKERIDRIYQLLEDGGDFELLAKQFSEDEASKKKAGKLGFIGINRFEEDFENAAYSLQNNGDYSAPVESSLGWHIIQRNAKKNLSDFEAIKYDLQNKIAKNDRYDIAREALIENIQSEGNFKEHPELLDSFSQKLDKEFYSYKWQIPSMDEKELFTFNNDVSYSNVDFAKFCKKSTRKRLRFNKNTVLRDAVEALYKDFTDEKTVAFEESRLEEKYPEFKALMREYEEGIFLFEATKMEVWDKASQDTTGLRKFYNKNKGMYEWKERAKVHQFSIISDDLKLAKKIQKHIRKKGLENALEKYNQEETLLHYQVNTYEHGSRELLGLEWKENAVSELNMPKGKKMYQFKQIVEIIPKMPKTLNEARGYIIADYQDQLEKNWISTLKNKYDVDIHEETLDKLIKSN